MARIAYFYLCRPQLASGTCYQAVTASTEVQGNPEVTKGGADDLVVVGKVS